MKLFLFAAFIGCSLFMKGQAGIQLVNAEGGEWLQQYFEKTAPPLGFVSGCEYYPYYFRARTSPILRGEEIRTAILTFQGRMYNNLVLQYDTYTDEVVYSYDTISVGNKIPMVSLNKYDASSFDLCFDKDTLHFRYLSNDTDPAFSLPGGYYEVVHDSKTQFIIRHRSDKYTILESNNAYAIDDYLYDPIEYINTGAGFQRITSRKQFIKSFGSASAQISRFLRTNRIRIKEADKGQVTRVLKYYEQLD